MPNLFIKVIFQYKKSQIYLHHRQNIWYLEYIIYHLREDRNAFT